MERYFRSRLAGSWYIWEEEGGGRASNGCEEVGEGSHVFREEGRGVDVEGKEERVGIGGQCFERLVGVSLPVSAAFLPFR